MTLYLQDADVTPTWIIERARGHRVPGLLHELKKLRDDGWDVTALLEADGAIVGLGYCAMAAKRLQQLSLLAETT